MPKNETLWDALRKQYGPEKGERVYYAMETEHKPAFRKGLATARREGYLTGGRSSGRTTRYSALHRKLTGRRG